MVIASGILLALVTGVLGSIGNVAFYAALGQGGMASVVVPMCSLYPVVTVLLALLLLREKVNTYQRIGVVLAVVAIIMLGG